MEFITTKKVPIILAIVIIFIIILAFLNGKKYEKFNFFEEATIQFVGPEGYGKVFFNENRPVFENKLNRKYSDKNIAELMEIGDASRKIEFRIPQEENLKNGDKVKIEIMVDKEVEDILELDISPKEMEYTVEGLKTPKVITKEQLFSGLEITYEGVSPNLKVNLSNKSTDEIISKVNYFVNGDKFIKGEKIQVKATLDYKFKNEYVLPEDVYLEQTIENVDAQLEDPNDINDTELQKMKQKCEEILKEKLESEISYGGMVHPGKIVTLHNFTYTNPNLKKIVVIPENEYTAYLYYGVVVNDNVLNSETEIEVVFEFPDVIVRKDGSVEYSKFVELIAPLSKDMLEQSMEEMEKPLKSKTF